MKNCAKEFLSRILNKVTAANPGEEIVLCRVRATETKLTERYRDFLCVLDAQTRRRYVREMNRVFGLHSQNMRNLFGALEKVVEDMLDTACAQIILFCADKEELLKISVSLHEKEMSIVCKYQPQIIKPVVTHVSGRKE